MSVELTDRAPLGEPEASEAERGEPRRGGGLYFLANLTSQAAALVRYVILARMLGPEQLGIAATLVVTAAFFDMISDTGSDRFLIQDRDGGRAEVQSLVHLVYVGRGLAVAACLALFAIPAARFYNTPQLALGLAVMGLWPLIQGFQHLDYRRLQRRHDFRPEAMCMIISEVCGLLATSIAAWLTHSFHAVLYGFVIRAVALVVMSHLQAKTPYRIGWAQAHAARLSRFAFPLMLNGLMLFIAGQGDRVIIGRELGVKPLGFYSAVMLLIYYPTVLIARYIHAIYIPLIAAERDRAEARNRITDELAGRTMVLSVAMALGFALVAPLMVPVLFGARFAQDPLLIALVGLLQVARFVLNWPTTAALAMGRSSTVLFSNITNLLAFATALLGLQLVGGLPGVVVGFLAGQFVCVFASIALLNRDSGEAPVHGFERLLELAAAGGVILVWNWAYHQGSWLGWAAALASALLLAGGLWWREADAIKALFGIVRHVGASSLRRVGLA